MKYTEGQTDTSYPFVQVLRSYEEKQPW